jgi:[NiFe] hydrogenase diaphorase moiety small subunit
MAGEILHFTIDGVDVAAAPGQSVIEAADAAGVYIPRLCHHPDLPADGNCRLCTCRIDGRHAAACVTPAVHGMVVENDTPELGDDRRTIIEMMFVEGDHPCPYCVASGDCELQAMGYRLRMRTPTQPFAWPKPRIDASHPDVLLDRDRCILCSRCIRASRLEDGKSVFGFEGRGIAMRLAVDGDGRLGDSQLAAIDRAARVCPVGCIVIKRDSYKVANGKRRFDGVVIGADIEARREPAAEPAARP